MSLLVNKLESLDLQVTPLNGALIVLGVFAGWRVITGKPRLPPGPRGLPLIGNLFDLATEFEWITFSKWADQWGPLVSASTLGTHIIVVSTYKKAVAMLENRDKSIMYSDRPHVTMAVDLMGWGASSHLQQYGPSFQTHRKVLHEELATQKGMKQFCVPVGEDRARNFASLVLRTPDKLVEHSIHHTASTLLRIIYGYTAKDYDDDFVRISEEAMRGFNLGVVPAARFAVNVIPFLRFLPGWLPGAGFQGKAKAWKAALMDMVLKPFTYTKDAVVAGTDEPSAISHRLRNGISPEDEATMVAVAASWLGAGSQNIAIIAQEEIEAVVGHDRLPTYEDRHSLPYLGAVIKEILRMHPSVPTGIPHTTSQDDVVDGYLIPKGSIIMFNIWKMGRDPELYKDPETFYPARFLGATPEQDPVFVWGFGRRVCPGRMLAEATIFTTLATCVATLQIDPILIHGKAVLPEFKPIGEPMK
ncbi:cytochrome P450 [Hymenopellis radicata]|nr:cytochrome P450 [Hymenopellis radicata]